ncbi:MAG: hypothetical protein ABEJ22_01465 [Haloferacaceae archaeon]
MGALFVSGVIAGIRYDLRTLHTRWMGIVFPQLRDDPHPVTGPWSPETPLQRALYAVWALLGAFGLLVLYPLTVLGLATRFYVRGFDRTATRIGVVGVVLLSVVVWGALTALARLRFSPEGFLAVGAAGAVATVSAVLAFGFSRVGGRVTSVLLAYPFAVTAIFLPPVVAALYSPALADAIFPRSTSLAVWLLDNVLAVGGLNELLRQRFDLVGYAYVGMWAGISVPVGWALGLLVALANLVRPADGAETDDAAA